MLTSTAKAIDRLSIRQIVGSIWTRAGVTIVLLAFVASKVNWDSMGHRLRHGHPLDFVAAVGLMLGALALGACRWWRLLVKADVHMSAHDIVRVYAISTFSNTFLPTTVGGDVTRALLVVRRGPLLVRVATTVVVERLGGLVGLIAIAWIGLAARPDTVPNGAQVFLTWITIVGIIAAVVATLGIFRGSRLRFLVPLRVTPMARELRLLLRDYASDPPMMVLIVGLSVIYQGLVAAQLVMLAQSIDVHLPLATAAVALTLVTIVTLIPISIGGFGIREGTYVILLAGASIAATEAALISVLSVVTLLIASLPGALLLVRDGVKPALEGV